MSTSPPGRALALATLARSRALLAEGHGALLVGTIAAVYALLAMLVGQMLLLGPTHLPSSVTIIPNGSPFWDFPALFVVAPNAVLILPFFGTLTMAIASLGVGIGMGVAVMLTARLLAARRKSSVRPAAIGTAAGLTPVMLTLVTLGACCSTTAAATAGISLAAQSTGTTFGAALAANWYLGVLQLVVLWVALLAQEEIVAVYGVLFARGEEPAAAALAPPPVSLRAGASAIARVLLVVAGLTWALGALAAATLVDPFTASAATWVDWLFLHVGLGSFAVIAGLFPRSLAGSLPDARPRLGNRLGRAVLGTASVLLLGTPPFLAGAGLAGFGNFLLGASGIAPAAGGVPLAIGGVSAGFVLASILLLALFGLATALRPTAALGPLLWSAARPPPAAVSGDGATSRDGASVLPVPPAELAPARWGEEP